MCIISVDHWNFSINMLVELDVQTGDYACLKCMLFFAFVVNKPEMQYSVWRFNDSDGRNCGCIACTGSLIM